MPLTCHLHELERKPLSLRGELPASELDLEGIDDLIHLRGPLRYDVEAQLLGRGVLVSGSLELEIECECVRCLKRFKRMVRLPDWTALLPLEGEEKVPVANDSVDLTEWIREDILLAFPQHPLCDPACGGLPYPGRAEPEEPGTGQDQAGLPAWNALNKLKF